MKLLFLAVLCVLVSEGICRSRKAKASKREMAIPKGVIPESNPSNEMSEESDNLFEKTEEMPSRLKSNGEEPPRELNDAVFEVEENLAEVAEEVDDIPEVAKAWANEFDEDLHFECPRKGAIHKVESEHSWTREDRRWLFECAKIAQKTSAMSCSWTKDTEVNEFDHPFYYECPVNHYLAGVASIHSHKKEDRQWRYKCCGSKTLTTDSCVLSEFVNWFGGALSYTAPEGHVMVGAGSINKNRMEDRIWKFSTCRYMNN